MDTRELMKQVGRIRIFTSRLVNDHLSGEYHSVFKGQGIEFDEVREYVAGDDIRSIDWNVTARMGHPFVKRFCEERELTVLFLVDISGSQCFGSGTRTKAEVAAEITSLLALSAIQNQDKVGLILFSDRIEKCIPPRKGRRAAIRLVREVLAAEQTRRGTDIAGALRFLHHVQKRKAVVFLVSDFQAADYQQELKIMARHHDVICCPVSDPREFHLPDIGLVEVEDPETRAFEWMDTSSPRLRHAFAAQARAARESLVQWLTRYRIDRIDLSTDQPFVDNVRRLFHQRQLRAGRHG
ncbi:MAG: hypothetical protein A2498_03415 [Lentisphaerae bacterium RIFOXYC12_FULL_60_16]|nr:MAG: hypothetical protein A2498_03415 [Lentisphaerae bacterium RIFOXYC12_FULL_60_16]